MSFYILRINIKQDNSGWSPRDDLYIYNTLQKVFDKLIQYLTTSIGCYETVWVGSTIELARFENYVVREVVDMHSHIFFELEKYPCIYFDPYNTPIAVKQDGSYISKTDSEFDEYFCVDIIGGDENIGVRIQVPQIGDLQGRIIEKDDIIKIHELPNTRLHYGHNDLLFGNDFSESELSEREQTENESDNETYDFI